MLQKVSSSVLGACLILSALEGGFAQPSGTPACVITGRVVDFRSNQTVPNAEVQLAAIEPGSDTPSEAEGEDARMQAADTARKYRVMSGANGDFCFESLPSGQYQLSATKAGFLLSSYGATSPFQSSAILDVDAGRRLIADVRLMPYGVISGKVTDSEGERVDSGAVQLLSGVWHGDQLRTAVVSGVVLDDLGQYRVGGLQPGTYYVRFQPRGSDNSLNVTGARVVGSMKRAVATYYPSALALNDAAPVRIGLGDHVAGNDVVVRHSSTYKVSGKLLTAGDFGRPPEYASISLVPVGEEPTMMLIGSSVLAPDGTFLFADVAPGGFNVVYFGGTGDSASAGRAAVSVVDRDITDVVIHLQTPVSVNGAISVEGEPEADIRKVEVRLMAVDAMGPGYGTVVRGDGSFVLEGCSPGRYTIDVIPPAGTFVRAIRYGASDITSSPLVISGSGPELTVVLARGAARLRGIIVPPKDTPVGGYGSGSAYYLVVPRSGRLDGSNVRFGHSDSGGAFFVKDLRPGPYRVFGFVTVDTGVLATPKVLRALESLGKEVELRANEETTLTTPLISAEEGGRIFSLGR